MSDRPATDAVATTEAAHAEFVTLTIADQLFGIPVLQVQDVLGPQRITRVPSAPSEVAGLLNLRGRIVTVIDVRTRLALPPRPSDMRSMSVVVGYKDEFYSLIVDKVGEVMSLPSADYERNPATLDPRWNEIADGIYRLKDMLLVILNVARLLQLDEKAAA
jgi:purine-binding chemotaxis protein CheW